MYCSPIWRPYLVKDISNLEHLQRRATKYILNDYISDYKTRLLKLELLPLMYTFELSDIMFFIKSIKNPTSSFNISFPSLPVPDQEASNYITIPPPLTSNDTFTL